MKTQETRNRFLLIVAVGFCLAGFRCEELEEIGPLPGVPIAAEITVRGRVTDAVTRSPVANARLVAMSGTLVLGTASTDADGRYSMAYGVYFCCDGTGTRAGPASSVSASAPGYRTSDGQTTCCQDKVLDFRLVRVAF